MKKTMFHRFGALALSMMMICSLMATPAFASQGGEIDPPGTTDTEDQEQNTWLRDPSLYCWQRTEDDSRAHKDEDKDGICDYWDCPTNQSGAKRIGHVISDGVCAIQGCGISEEDATKPPVVPDQPADPKPTGEQTGTFGGNKTLTIKNAISGATYTVYQVLDLTYNGPASEDKVATFEYRFDPALEKTLKSLIEAGYGDTGSGLKGDYGTMIAGFGITGDHLYFNLVNVNNGNRTIASAEEYDKWIGSADGRKFASDFAEDLRAAIEANPSILGDSAAATRTVGDEATELEITGLTDGYYMVTSGKTDTAPSDANRWAMTTSLFGDRLEIREKNTVPTLTKKVYEDADKSMTDKNDKAVGDTVFFEARIDTGAGITGLRFVDTLSQGLTFGELVDIAFYPRNENGKVSVENADETNRKAYGDAKYDGDNEVAYSGGGMADDEFYENFNKTHKQSSLYLDAEAVLNGNKTTTLTVDFAEIWLKSMRYDEEKHPEKAPDDRAAYTLDPLDANDKRLSGLTDADPAPDVVAKQSNQYIGDTSTKADDGGIIVIKYTATVNADAVVGGKGNENTAKVQYLNKPSTTPTTPDNWPETPEEETRTYVYELDVLKHALGANGTVLPGAKFTLHRMGEAFDYAGVFDPATVGADKTDKAVQILTSMVKDGKIEIGKAEIDKAKEKAKGDALSFVKRGDNYYVVTAANPAQPGETATTELVSDANGKINVVGLDSDLYVLTETAAPDGYIKADEPMYVILGSVHSGTVTFDKDKNVEAVAFTCGDTTADPCVFTQANAAVKNQVNVANASGIQMPETGGIGTTIFYIVGIALVVGAGVLLVVKKRMGRSED